MRWCALPLITPATGGIKAEESLTQVKGEAIYRWTINVQRVVQLTQHKTVTKHFVPNLWE